MSEKSRRACRVPGNRVLQIVSGDFPLESWLAEATHPHRKPSGDLL